MEEIQAKLSLAERKIKIADHILTQTFPLLKDPKLLLSVVNNVQKATEEIMSTILAYERAYKRIPVYSNNFEQKYHIFKEKIAPKYRIETNLINIIRDMKEIVEEHKKSPVEFSRNNQFVICSDRYKIKTINQAEIKKHINSTKLLLEKAKRIIR